MKIFVLLILYIHIPQTETALVTRTTDIFTIGDLNKHTWGVTTKRNKDIQIRIKGNSSTGYSWFLDKATSTGLDLLVPSNLDEFNSVSEYINDRSRGYGSEEYFNFRFKTLVKKGIAQLKFIYKKSWEEEILYKLAVKVKIN
jgi:predicted secreted protein